MDLIRACLLGVAISMAPVQADQAAEDIETLEVLLHEFMAGASRDDIRVHDRFWADDLVYTSSKGARFGKKEIMQALEEGLTSNEPTPDTSYLAENVKVRLYGDMAVVTFRLISVTHEAEFAGRPKVENFYNTSTFVRREGDWRVVAWQATRIPED